MALVVKLMSGENEPDNDTRKSYKLIAEVLNVEFERDGDDAYAWLWFKPVTFSPSEGAGSIQKERFLLSGNVYVMNEDGKTISSFGVAPPESVSRKLVAAERFAGRRENIAAFDKTNEQCTRIEGDDTFTHSFRAEHWAKAFVERVREKGVKFAKDEGNMIGWFANALMRGYDTAFESDNIITVGTTGGPAAQVVEALDLMADAIPPTKFTSGLRDAYITAVATLGFAGVTAHGENTSRCP